MTRKIECDVIIAGLGPSGMMAAAFLLKRGWRVVTVEKHKALYGYPRAGHVDHEIVRLLQELGSDEPFLADAYPIKSYRWYNAHGQVLVDVNWGEQSISGFNSDYMMYQPVMEDCIQSSIDAHSQTLTELRGYELEFVSQNDGHVVCEAFSWSREDERLGVGEEKIELTGKFLLAADGARSSTREMLGIGREDLNFHSVWLDVDVRVLRPLPKVDPHQICDPKRPIFISPLGKRHHRFEWCLLPGENPKDFESPDLAWKLMAEQGVGPEDVEIVRQQVYTFEAKIADRWQVGRVFLLGDAAHLTPPFMGQGACSGMRDAVNIAWKLDLVMSGVSPIDLLETYEVEREPHTRTWIELAMLVGDISCTLDEKAAAERDEMYLSGNAPAMADFPELTAGILDLDDRNVAVRPVGTPFPQREVRRNGLVGWIDDIVGTGFRVVSWKNDMKEALGPDHLSFLSAIGASHIVLSDQDDEGSTVDITGFYKQWMEEGGFSALIVRPDHYIYGIAKSDRELGGLVDGLRQRLVAKAPVSLQAADYG